MADEIGDSQVKTNRLIHLISTYPFSCDFIISLFYTSVFSSRFESRAIPFPPNFINDNGEKDVASLRKLLKLIPPLAILRKLLHYSHNFEYIDILDWLFSVIDPKELELAETSHLNLPIEQQPDTVFGIRASETTDKAWNKKKGQRSGLYVFYGTNLENIYSIAKHGLNPIFSTATVPLYGDGLYLTNHMAVSLLFSPFSEGWKYSMIGEKLSVLVLCEVIEDNSKIKRLKKHSTSEERVDYSYVLVKDKNYARVKYFFVYTKDSSESPFYKMCLYVFILGFIVFTFALLYSNKELIIDMFSSLFLK